MDSQPLFSIICAAYNAEETLGKALDSVLAQTYNKWELLVVDDGSADATLKVARGYEQKDNRVRVITQPNAGCAAARNAGAILAHGDYVTKFDADDELEPFALQCLADLIEAQPGYDIYSATGTKVFPNGRTEPFFLNPRFAKECSLTLSDLLDECYIFGGAATIRRDTLEKIDGFRPQAYCEDYDVWLRALAVGATHRYTPQPIYIYNFGTDNHMNEDPTKSLTSFIAIFSDLIASGVLCEKDKEHAQKSIEKFENSLQQYEARGATEAEYTNLQARRFQESVFRIFGEKGGAWVMSSAAACKWMVKPFRVFLAKRSLNKSAKDTDPGKGNDAKQ